MMGKIWRRRLMWGLAGLAVLAAAIYGFWPQPIPADLAQLEYRPFQVTVDDEGVARIRDFYVVSAPVAGTVTRSTLEVGDYVKQDETVIAQIRPSAPSLLDTRNRRTAEAAVKIAQAGLSLAEANLARARAELQFAQGELERTERLAQRGVAPERTLDQVRTEVQSKQAALDSAEAQIAINTREVERARANLIEPTDEQLVNDESCCVTVKSPVSGNVIKVVTKSEIVVSPGASLVELGNPRDLEIVVELLSADAVRVKEGDEAIIEDWGGRALRARVRRIEPTAFQKVSALGIEEQRVLVRLDLISDPAEWQRLGHDYRVFVRIVVWETDRALTVPLSALFRQGDDWAVFTVTDGRARLRLIELGERNLRYAIVQDGLSEGDRVILHPNDQIKDDVRIVERRLLEE